MLYGAAGDRRLNKYNESSGGYGRSYPAAEPEWFTEGPISQSDTIELRGFDTAHSDRPRTRNTSGSDASHDGSRLDREKVKPGRRDKVDGGGKTGGAKNKENSLSNSRDVGETASDTLLNDERREESDRGQCAFRCVRNLSVIKCTRVVVVVPCLTDKLLSDATMVDFLYRTVSRPSCSAYSASNSVEVASAVNTNPNH